VRPTACCLLRPVGMRKTAPLRLIDGHGTANLGDIVIGAKMPIRIPAARRGRDDVPELALFPHLTRSGQCGVSLQRLAASQGERARSPRSNCSSSSTWSDMPSDCRHKLWEGSSSASRGACVVTNPEILPRDEAASELDQFMRTACAPRTQRGKRSSNLVHRHAKPGRSDGACRPDSC